MTFIRDLTLQNVDYQYQSSGGLVLPGETRVLKESGNLASLINYQPPPVTGALWVIGLSGRASR